ncbi:Ig-like domain-containing protein, partial [Roseovarius sp. D22-M7]|uniref:Ig-like domain-containing protein n=1 Tax=Roseovarius sp. D22-M7 TaxID=3127116 RepID=UPI00300FEDB3
SFGYTPDAGFSGSDSFTYFANDGSADAAAPAAVTITVADPTNTAPVVADETYSTDDGETLTIGAALGLLANDSDPDAADTIFVQSFTAAGNGDLSVTTDGSFEYTPDPGFVGAETISYTVSDGTATDQGTLTIDVVNEGPVVADETYTTDDGETLTIGAAAGLLANDSDPDAADTIFVQ